MQYSVGEIVYGISMRSIDSGAWIKILWYWYFITVFSATQWPVFWKLAGLLCQICQNYDFCCLEKGNDIS